MFLALSIKKIWNVDIWWQLSTGRWIVEHRDFPRVDQFSYTVPTHSWIELRWVFCILAYWGWQLGGAPLLILVQTMVMAAVFGLVIAGTRSAARTVPGMCILGLGVFAFASRYVVRPEIITYLMVALFLVILHATARGKTKCLAWLLPALQVIWVNSHTLFVMGPVIAWFFAIGCGAQRMVSAGIGWPAASDDDERQSTGLLAKMCIVATLVTLACMVNPYGLEGALFPITLWREIHKGGFLGTAIEEFKSPFSFEALTPDIHMAGVLALAAGATFLWNWRRTNFTRLALCAAHVYLACVAVRNVGLLAVVGTWIALANIADTLADPPSKKTFPARLRRFTPIGHSLLAIVYLAAAWYVASDRSALKHGVETTGLGINPGSRPEGAVLFLRDNPDLQPNVFHDMTDGSFLAWANIDGFKVFVDPRLEVYGEDMIKRFMSITPDNFPALCDQYGINVVVLNSKRMNELGRWLRNAADWTLVHLDERNLIYVRNILQHASVIERHRVNPARNWMPQAGDPDESPRGLYKLIGGVSRPWYSLGMARSLLLIGSVDHAEQYLRRALASCPQDGETRLTLAQVERSRGHVKEAKALLAELTMTPFDRQWADRLFAQMFQDQAKQLRDQGRMAQVIPVLEQACMASPRDGELLIALALGYLETQNFERAASAYRVLAQSWPNQIEFVLNLGRASEGAGDSSAAIDAFRRALVIDPSNAIASEGVARLTSAGPSSPSP